jgi:hypothetical protein
VEVFLSHHTGDHDFAALLRERLLMLRVGVFMLPETVGPGAEWLDEIDGAVRRCDLLLSLISPESARRPWIAAEWAAFRFSGKTCIPLLLRASASDVWEPMRTHQAVDLGDRFAVEELLTRLSDTDEKRDEAVIARVAGGLAAHPAVRWTPTQALERVTARLTYERFNIRAEDVQTLCDHNMLDALIAAARLPTARAVKQRQLALELIANGHLREAGDIADAIASAAELKNLLLGGIEELSRAPKDVDPMPLVERVWPKLDAEKREVVARALASVGLDAPPDMG